MHSLNRIIGQYIESDLKLVSPQNFQQSPIQKSSIALLNSHSKSTVGYTKEKDKKPMIVKLTDINHTINIEKFVQKYRHEQKLGEIKGKLQTISPRVVPTTHTQPRLMRAISKFQNSKQNMVNKEMAKQRYQFQNFKQKSTARLLQNIPEIDKIDKNLQDIEGLAKNMSTETLQYLLLSLS